MSDNPLLNWNRDAKDCDACHHLDDQCPYHHGVTVGIEWMTWHLAAISRDPELLNRLVDRG